jgi:thymidine phosphorylase
MAQPDNVLFRKVVREAGCAIIGQTGHLAPADKKLYAIRDVTATVESIPLITASILSKKLAAGLQALVMDVKVGNGAFMSKLQDARTLAESLAGVAAGAGLPTTALITDMNEPLASAAGNGLEILNAVDYLTGSARDPRLHQVTLALGAAMLVNGGLCADHGQASAQLERALASGRAAECFSRMTALLGGPHDFVERAGHYIERAPVRRTCLADQPGFVTLIDARAIGIAVISLGGGRTRPQDAIDHRVGFSRLAPLGAVVEKGSALGLVHARNEDEAAAAIASLRKAFTIGGAAPPARHPVIEHIGEPSPA